MAEGIVPGGGLALLRCVETVEEAAKCTGVVVDRMRGGTGSHGFDAARGEYVELREAGIIDPTKVVRVALENAVSVASVLLLTEAALTGIPEEKEDPRLEPALEA